jgi:hypothetical protein
LEDSAARRPARGERFTGEALSRLGCFGVRGEGGSLAKMDRSPGAGLVAISVGSPYLLVPNAASKQATRQQQTKERNKSVNRSRHNNDGVHAALLLLLHSSHSRLLAAGCSGCWLDLGGSLTFQTRSRRLSAGRA